MDLLRGFPGSDRVLARHAPALPQPDQLCGPFAAHVALHAVADTPPSVTDLAVASGTRVLPGDHTAWRPPVTAPDTTGWAELPRAAGPEESGTDAAGLAAGLTSLGTAEVIPVREVAPAPLARLLAALLDGPPVGVLANVRTGAMDPAAPFDVGHFVVLWGCSADGSLVGVADTYPELGDPGQPAGCRVVPLEALHAGLTAAPGRGLLLLVTPDDAPVVRRLASGSGATSSPWSA